MKRKIVIALVGLSKGGKTSLIASLAQNPKEMIVLHAKDDSRTKLTVNYELVPYEEGMHVEVQDINWNKAKIACGNDFKNIEKYNEQVRTNPNYQKIGLKEIEATEYFYKELLTQLEQIEQSISISEVLDIINTENVDLLITGITITVPTNEILSQELRKENMSLILRDTRGLLDILVSEENNGKKLSTKPLAELGLDGLNAIIFLCSREYQDVIAEIYSDMLNSVMTAVPIFMAYRDGDIKRVTVEKMEDVSRIIEEEREIEDNFDSKFYPALKFLSKIDITEPVSDSEFTFKTFNYFDKERVEYIYPECIYLSKLMRNKEVEDNPLDDPSYITFKLFTTYIMIDIVEKLMEYYNNILKIFKGNALAQILKENRYVFQTAVQDDFKQYGVQYHTNYARPQVDYENHTSIARKMCDVTVDILGPRSGITTMNGRKMVYVATAISGVTLDRALKWWINRQSFQIEELTELGLARGKQSELIKKAMLYVLQKRFVDYFASIQGYTCMNRYVIRENLEIVRNKHVGEGMAMYEYAGFVLDAFCNELEQVSNEEVWGLIIDSGKNKSLYN